MKSLLNKFVYLVLAFGICLSMMLFNSTISAKALVDDSKTGVTSPEHIQFALGEISSTKPSVSVDTSITDRIYQKGKTFTLYFSDIALSDDTNEESVLRSNLEARLIAPNGVDVDITIMSTHYYWSLDVAGIYTLKLSVTDSDMETGEYVVPINVKSDGDIYRIYRVGNVVSTLDLTDSALYSALIDIIKDYAETRGHTLEDDFDKLYDRTISSITSITSLDLSGKSIKSLNGLNKIKLDNIKTLNLSENQIERIGEDDLSSLTELNSLDLSTNKLLELSLKPIKRLNSLNLSKNSLTELDMSHILGADVNLNLAGNDVTNMSKIKLPTFNSLKLNMIGNNLSYIPNEYLSSTKIEIALGVQGAKRLGDESRVTTISGLSYYKTGIDNLGLMITLRDVEKTVVAVIKDSDIEGNFKAIRLSVGKYYYEYVIIENVGGEDQYTPIYDRWDSNANYYYDQDFTVVPAVAKATYEYNGQTYDTIGKVTGSVIVHLDAEPGAKIYYSIGNGEWKEGSDIVCDQGGVYSIRTKVVIDGYESDTASLQVRTSLNTRIPDTLMFFFIFASAIILFVVVVPIISKKFFK